MPAILAIYRECPSDDIIYVYGDDSIYRYPAGLAGALATRAADVHGVEFNTPAVRRKRNQPGPGYARLDAVPDGALLIYQYPPYTPTDAPPECPTPPPEPTWYFKLDDYPDDAIPETISGDDLPQDSPFGPAITAGKIDNCYDGNSFKALRSSSDYEFSGIPFTVRMWVKLTAPPTRQLIRGDNTSLFDPGAWDLEVRFDGTARFRVITDFGATDTAAIATDTIADNEWHMLTGWFNPGVEVGVQVDDLPAVTTPAAADALGTGGTVLTMPAGFATDSYLFDEVAIWKGVALTEGQRKADYADGDGETWPWATD